MSKYVTNILCAVVSGLLILSLAGFHNKYDELKEYNVSVGYLVKMAGVGKERYPCFLPISSVVSSQECKSAAFKQYTSVYSKADYYRMAAKHQPLWGYEKTEAALKNASRVAGFEKPEPPFYSKWLYNFGESVFDERGGWNTAYRFILFALRITFFVNIYLFILRQFLLRHLRRFAHANDGVLECLRKIGGNTDGAANAATNAIILKSVIVTGLSAIVVGGTFTMIVTLKAPVLKMSFDPLKADVNHAVGGGISGNPNSQLAFANRTTLNLHLGKSTMELLNKWPQIQTCNSTTSNAELLRSIDRRISEIENELKALSTAKGDVGDIKRQLAEMLTELKRIKQAMK